MLCKTAFNIAVERASKYAKAHGRRLRVIPEKCNKNEDRDIKTYYSTLKKEGLPFSAETSQKYGPLNAQNFNEILYELDFKKKSSPMVQLADLYLWPMMIGGYDRNNRPYKRLHEDGKLIERYLSPDDTPTMGTKYSCWERVNPTP